MKQHIKQQIEQSQNPPEVKSQFAKNFVAPGQTPSTQYATNPTEISSNNDLTAEKTIMQVRYYSPSTFKCFLLITELERKDTERY